MRRTLLTGVTVVRADRVEARRTLVFEDATLVDIVAGVRGGAPNETTISLDGRVVVPGFVDAHVHGVEGTDVLDGAGAVRARGRAAAPMGRDGVLPDVDGLPARHPAPCSFATVASPAGPGRAGSARVLPAHLESNFINPAFRGAQPIGVSCAPRRGRRRRTRPRSRRAGRRSRDRRPNVGIVTLAPEMPGGIDLVRRLVAAGIRVSLGHSGATFEEARAAIHAGACRATHLFNAMPPDDASRPRPGRRGARP